VTGLKGRKANNWRERERERVKWSTVLALGEGEERMTLLGPAQDTILDTSTNEGP
jgi:hypothetical protein